MAKGLEGIINVGAVDMTTDQAAGAQYGIKGFPTIKFFGNNKQKPADYSGQRKASDMMDYAFERARKIANARAFYRGGSNQKKNQNQQKQQQQQKQQKQQNNQKKQKKEQTGGNGGDGSVVILKDSNFDSLVYNSKDVWFVEFYAPWCGHCKRLQPEWEAAAKQVQGIKWGKVNCMEEKRVCQQLGVNGYPTIKHYLPGSTGPSDAQDYTGGRTQTDLADHAMSLYTANMPAKEVKHLKSQADYNEYCVDTKGVCFIFLLPHIYDSSEQERKDTLKMLNKVKKIS